MPACVAHYQFGQELLSRLNADLRSVALAYKPEFDCGLQGPDVFFFYKPYHRSEIRDYGASRHNQPALGMFAPILEKNHKNAALSYLIGLICHYALDKNCHPYVIEYSNDSDGGKQPYGHQNMESAFDRYVTVRSGLSKERYHYLPADGLDYEAMAALWPDINAVTLRKCVTWERRAIRFLDHRNLLATFENILGKPGVLTPMTMPAAISEKQTVHIHHLNALYEKALNECPNLIQTALEAMGTKQPDLHGFELNYKGKAMSKE